LQNNTHGKFQSKLISKSKAQHHTQYQSKQTMVGVGGFDIGQAAAHAIFLDLPEPWNAIPHAAHTLKPNGRICSYSPCMEQTQRTVLTMKQYGFHSTKTIEVRLREHYVDTDVQLERVPTDILSKELGYGGGGGRKHHHIPGNGIKTYHKGEAPEAIPGHIPAKPKPKSNINGNSNHDSEGHPKKRKINDSNDANNQNNSNHENGIENLQTSSCTTSSSSINNNNNTEKLTKVRKLTCARPFATMRGHTAFLTFATAGNTPHPGPNKS